MKNKGFIILALTFSLIAFLSSGIFAVGESCFITDKASCSGTIVMGLSNTTNAHGETANQSNYNEVLCCNFAGSKACDGTNKIIGLSSVTNAHAEIPTEINYPNNVCYGNLSCVSTSQTCGNQQVSNYSLSIFSLSNYTNAHIGEIGNYSINICCNSNTGSGTPTQSIYWANSQGSLISNTNISVGNTIIKLVLENTGLPNGTAINFSIYENNLILPDNFIRTLYANVDANGKVVAEWTVAQTDLDKTPNDYNQFYRSEERRVGKECRSRWSPYH